MAKGVYACVDGVSRNVKQIPLCVDSVSRQTKAGYACVDGVSRQFFPSGTAAGDLDVGSSVYMNVDGERKEFLVVHQGLPSSLYDSTCNGTWLLMKDIYTKRAWYSSVNSPTNNYSNSDIHTYLKGTFLGLFDSDIQSAINQIKLPYLSGTGSGGTIISGSYGLSTKIFLLSGYEVGWTATDEYSFPEDGACLDYFSGTATTDSKRIGYYNGTASTWWLRSAKIGSTQAVWFVQTTGGQQSSSCYSSFGIRPALILPSDISVDSDFNIIAS